MNAMKYMKTLLLALLFAILMPLSQAAAGDTTMVYTQEQVDSIVAKEVQKAVKAEMARQVDGELIDLKIDKAENEKLATYISEQNNSLTKHDFMVGGIITFLAAIVGIVIPLIMNRNIENKLNENTKGLEKSKEDLEKSKKELEESKKKLAEHTKGLEESKRELEESRKELEESKLRLSKSEKVLEETKRELEQSKKELSDLKGEIVGIHHNVAQMNKAAKKSKDDAEKAARQSKFSEKLSQAQNEKNFFKKMGILTHLIEMYPEDEFRAQSYFARGLVCDEEGSYDQAIADYTEVIRLKPDYAEAYIGRGVCYYRIGEPDKAIEDFTEVIKREPGRSSAYYGRAGFYESTGQYVKAIADYTEAIEQEPGKSSTYLCRAKCYENTCQNDKAEADYMEAIRRNPEDLEAYFSRAEYYKRTGQYDKAEADYTKIMAIRPNSLRSYLYKCGVLQKLGRLDEALEVAECGLEIAHNNETSWMYSEFEDIIKEIKKQKNNNEQQN